MTGSLRMDSWKSVRKDFKDTHLIMIGRGYFENLVKKQQKKDKRIHLVPYVDKKEDLAKYYNISDIFAFPTRLEGFGRTAAEAMSCGVPVVTTNAKGIRDVVIDKKTGYMVDTDNSEQFSDKLKSLLNDVSIRKKMGYAAIKRVEENFTWKSSINKTERFMQNLVK